MIIWGKIKIVSFSLHPKALGAGYPIRPHKYTSAENCINRWKSQEEKDSCLARAHTVCSGLNWTPEPPDCSDQGLPIPAPQQGSMWVLGSRSNSWAGTWLSKRQGEWHRIGYQRYGCVACDEYHYLLMDSNYNTNTIFSYNFVHRMFQVRKRIIFMSATMEEFQKQIEMVDFCG